MHEFDPIFHDRAALLFRLHEALQRSKREVVFVLGAPLTAPHGDKAGVADVSAIVALIRNEFVGHERHLRNFDSSVSSAANPYQAAFDFLSGHAGQGAANQVVRRAVACSINRSGGREWGEVINELDEGALRDLEADPAIWALSPGVDALGELAANFPQFFGARHLTSNFDPLIEVAVRRHGGNAWRTSLASDGSITQSTAKGCQIIHIHGYWHGADTLHTSQQLLRSRPTLKNDLLSVLKDKLVVVMAYGGWPDIFTQALAGIVNDENLFPEILWTFYDEVPVLNGHIYDTLYPGLVRNRVVLYRGIDCHQFLPELLAEWRSGVQSVMEAPAAPSPIGTESKVVATRSRLFRLAPLECDRPPSVDVWVGRENEIRSLETSLAKVAIICGMGGEGKSALAAHYITTLEDQESALRFWDWRDCKEQNDRIRTQIVEIIDRFSEGNISAEALSGASDWELVEVLIDHVQNAHSVLVFDNVDSYVDLENRKFTGILNSLVERISSAVSTSRIVITCRPDVQYASSSVITLKLGGLSEEETKELFRKRASNMVVPDEDIREAHISTDGHAFKLDLMAAQVAKVPGTTLRKLLNDMRRGRDDGPDILSPLWDRLSKREQTLLRFMAEAMRPESANVIEGFVASEMNFQRFNRALRGLISVNLIVVKPQADAPDLYDLHPLVRQFVRTKFERRERSNFIRVVLKQYDIIIGKIGSLLGINLPYAMLERWSQKAELQVAAGLLEDAFETLAEIEDAFLGGGHVEEFVRVGRLLFETIDWETASVRYKEFDNTVALVVAAMDQLNEFESADNIIRRYEQTIPEKTARYINLCRIKAHSYWMRNNFPAAIFWGTQGVDLKKKTNVDTNYDCEHDLALARRDAGNPEIALEYFRSGYDVADIISGAETVSGHGPLFGNVGRCFHLMGRSEDALSCYKTSLQILEGDLSSHSKSNRAYGRRWVGEILAANGDTETAEAFYMDAIRLLGRAAPLRVRDLYADVESVRGNSIRVMDENRAARIVDRWIGV